VPADSVEDLVRATNRRVRTWIPASVASAAKRTASQHGSAQQGRYLAPRWNRIPHGRCLDALLERGKRCSRPTRGLHALQCSPHGNQFGQSTREWTCRRSVSARDTAAWRSRPGTLPPCPAPPVRSWPATLAINSPHVLW